MKINCPEIDYISIRNKANAEAKIDLTRLELANSSIENIGTQIENKIIDRAIAISDTPHLEIVIYYNINVILMEIDQSKLNEYNKLIKIHYKSGEIINIEDFLHMMFMNYTPIIKYKKSIYKLYPNECCYIEIDVHKYDTVISISLNNY